MKDLLRSAMASVTVQIADNESVAKRCNGTAMAALLAFSVLAAVPGQANAQDWSRYVGPAAAAAGAAIGAKADKKNPWAGAAIGTAVGHGVGEYVQHGEIRNPEVLGAGVGGVVGRAATKNHAGTAVGALAGAVVGNMVGSESRREAEMRRSAGNPGMGQHSNTGTTAWNPGMSRASVQHQRAPQVMAIEPSGPVSLSEAPRSAQNLEIAKENMFKYRDRLRSAIAEYEDAQETPMNFDGRNKAAVKLDTAKRNFAAAEVEYIHVRNTIARKGFNVSEVDQEVMQRLTSTEVPAGRAVEYNYNQNRRSAQYAY